MADRSGWRKAAADLLRDRRRDGEGRTGPRRPDSKAVEGLIGGLRRLLFPEYFSRSRGVLAYGEILWIVASLRRLLYRAYRGAGAPGDQARQRGSRVCRAFFRELPRVRTLAEQDLRAAFDGDPAAANREEIVFSYPGLYAVTVYRLAHELYVLGVPMLPRILTEHAHSRTGIDIHPGAVIGRGFFIDHGTGVVIGETTRIGDSVKLYQGVTLGALSTRGGNSLRGRKRHPTIEDGVTIYAGASILGGDTVIGAGAVIGGNAFITGSVASGAVVTLPDQPLCVRYPKEV